MPHGACCCMHKILPSLPWAPTASTARPFVKKMRQGQGVKNAVLVPEKTWHLGPLASTARRRLLGHGRSRCLPTAVARAPAGSIIICIRVLGSLIKF